MLDMMAYFPGGVGLRLIRVLEIGRAITLTGCFAIASTGVLGTITLTGCFAIAFSANPAVAQITPDATLGTESSVVTPNLNIRGLPTDQINGGAVRGTNLFHSFQEFNVGDGQRVYFANPAGIENILSRVTGNNLSNILGTLGVDGGASLFLLNPNGIIFGSNAQLDISGSFVASTANSVVFDNGYQFSAKNTDTPSLLTVSVPLGVQYGANQPRTTIANTGTLAVKQNLTLSAGNLDLQGLVQAGKDLTLEAQDTVKIRDTVINPFIAAAGGKLLVQGNGMVDIFALNHANSGFFSGGDMVLRSPNSVMGDAHYTTGGNFRIEQLDGSLGNLWSPGDPVIRASGNVSFTDYTGASLHIFAGGSVNITGRVTITGADALNFINETVTLSQTLPDGTNTVTVNGSTRPTLDIRAGTTAVGTPVNVCVGCPLFQPTNLTFPNTPLTADITINEILINRPDGLVFLTNQYQPNLALTGNIQVTGIFADDGNGDFSGKASDVVIDSRGNITLPDDGRIQTNSGTGNGGNVTLIANGSFIMLPGSQMYTYISGQGKAGNITIKVGDAVSLIGDRNPNGVPTIINANVESGGVGDGGEITIEAGSLSIDDTQIQSAVRGAGGFLTQPGQGNAGNVNINVRDAVVITWANSGIFTPLDVGTTGNSGNINIQAGTLTITDGGVLQAGVFSQGEGKAGTITLDVSNITIAGVNAASGISSRVSVATSGEANSQAGKITIINTDKLRVADGAVLNASTSSSANGGEIAVNANILELTGGGQILAVPRDRGNGGNVKLNITDQLTVSGFDSAISTGGFLDSTGDGGNISIIGTREVNVSDIGQISTLSLGSGNAGNLSITQTDSVNLANQGLITTSTFGTGKAGSLLIDTGKLNLQNQSVITSSTAGAGNAGELNIRASDSVEVLSGSRIVSETVGTGNGADLTIVTGRLVTRNGEISTSTIFESSGRGGNLRVVASNSVDISGEVGTAVGGLYSSTLGSGQGGNLTVETARLSVREGGRIEAGTGGIAPGGNVNVNASDSIELIGTSALGILPNGVATFLPSGISSFSLQLYQLAKCLLRIAPQQEIATSLKK
jgi:filamentous hemagglutinin family protein